jgi:uncharacterized membrane protein
MRVPALVVAALLVLPLLGTTGAAGPVLGGASPAPDRAVAAGTTVDASTGATTTAAERPYPKTVLRANLTRDGDANWSVASRFEVNRSDPDEVAAFEDLYDEVRTGETDVGYDASLFRGIVGDVSAAAGREMAIEDVRWTMHYAGNDTGVIALRFRWTNFADARAETVAVGDAFATEDGTWLPELRDGQRLVLVAPENYAVSLPTSAEGSRRLVFEGPTTFAAGQPAASFAKNATTPTTTTPNDTTPGTPGRNGTTTTTPGTTPNKQTGGGGSLLFWLGFLVVLVSVGAGVYWYFLADEDDAPGGAAGATDAGGAGGSSADGGQTAAESATADEAGTADGTGAAAASASGSDAAAAGEDAAGSEPEPDDGGIDPELLSDEERVEQLLERNGGRMKQGNIVKETGWSNAKVSQLLSAMDDDDRIDKLRIGRENLITLPDEDVTDF